jgi:hypothetical protein
VTSVAEDTKSKNLKFVKLDEEIVRFDRLLEELQDHVPEDMRAYQAIVSARDYIFRMQQIMHGVEIMDFAVGNDGGDI